MHLHFGCKMQPMARPTSQAIAIDTQASAPWRHDTAFAVLAHVLRLTAPNPGLMTGPGTNSYLVGDMDCGFAVLDPGPVHAEHQQRLWALARHADGSGGNIRMIVCTHSHSDHSPGAAPLQALCAQRPPILGLASAPTARPASVFVPDRQLHDGERLVLQSQDKRHTLHVLHTPGHAANHVCLLHEESALLFSGDHILNGSTTVIDPPDGNMDDYLRALDRLHGVCSAHAVQHILPAHGRVIDQALAAILGLKAHRLAREQKIATVMQTHPDASEDTWLALAYDDVDPSLWPVARRSFLAHAQRIAATRQSGTPAVHRKASP